MPAGGDQSPAGPAADPFDDQQPLGHDALGRPGSAGPPLDLHVKGAGLPADGRHDRM